jgi:hypothetical protein
MRVGQEVNLYFPGTATRVTAEVISIDRVGESLAKRVTLRYDTDEGTAEIDKVPHYQDALPGEIFWLLKGTERVPSGWADVEVAEDAEEREPYLVAEEE